MITLLIDQTQRGTDGEMTLNTPTNKPLQWVVAFTSKYAITCRRDLLGVAKFDI